MKNVTLDNVTEMELDDRSAAKEGTDPDEVDNPDC